ncbi:hypothetical protein RhiJN_23287 [Ceratobasidium sp. AG-Ba]|nr:hypothetical protein RhiJN_23287 [Ceratobasidium sp. AG-Ba]
MQSPVAEFTPSMVYHPLLDSTYPESNPLPEDFTMPPAPPSAAALHPELFFIAPSGPQPSVWHKYEDLGYLYNDVRRDENGYTYQHERSNTPEPWLDAAVRRARGWCGFQNVTSYNPDLEIEEPEEGWPEGTEEWDRSGSTEWVDHSTEATWGEDWAETPEGWRRTPVENEGWGSLQYPPPIPEDYQEAVIPPLQEFAPEEPEWLEEEGGYNGDWIER